MANQRDGISWCDETWNPTRGCRRVSEGCRHCWAERQAARMASTHYSGLVQPARPAVERFDFHCPATGPRWTGRAVFVPQQLAAPLRWRKPRRVAVSLMGDLFHESLTFREIAAVYGVMAACPQHTFLILTKRPERMLEFYRWLGCAVGTNHTTGSRVTIATDPLVGCEIQAGRYGVTFGAREPLGTKWPLGNVWVGVSAENQETLEQRWPHLMNTPAAVRWLSLEPLLGAINLGVISLEVISRPCDWVVVGCESGPGRRPCRLEWIESIVEQCREASVPVHVKQVDLGAVIAREMCRWPKHLRVRQRPETRP